MTKLIVNSTTGQGSCINRNGTEISVLRVNGLYNLRVRDKHGYGSWVKEDAKRISILQEFADRMGYFIKIEVI